MPGNTITVSMPMTLKKRGGHPMILVPNHASLFEEESGVIDKALVKALVRAHLWQGELDKGLYDTFSDLAAAYGVTKRYVQLLLPLTSFSPRLMTKILYGMQPRTLKLADLLNKLPVLWEEQEPFLQI